MISIVLNADGKAENDSILLYNFSEVFNMLKKLIPDEYYESVYDIPYEEFHSIMTKDVSLK